MLSTPTNDLFCFIPRISCTGLSSAPHGMGFPSFRNGTAPLFWCQRSCDCALSLLLAVSRRRRVSCELLSHTWLFHFLKNCPLSALSSTVHSDALPVMPGSPVSSSQTLVIVFLVIVLGSFKQVSNCKQREAFLPPLHASICSNCKVQRRHSLDENTHSLYTSTLLHSFPHPHTICTHTHMSCVCVGVCV